MVNHGMYKRYYHDVIGVNSQDLDSIQAAAILDIKLPRLDAYCDARRKAAQILQRKLLLQANILITPKMGNGCESNL